MYIKTLTVGKLNNYIKKIMDNDFILRNIYVKGEISNLKLHSSGHIYFTLKDPLGKINCVMFKDDAENLKFVPEDGMEVLVTGRVSVYIKGGNYQIYCSEMEISGVGKLYIEFENLKNKLYEEGLFDEKHKKSLPKYPQKIGVVTSPTGAAIRDIINVCKRRNPSIEIVIYPSLVQGENASLNIIKGLDYLDNIKDIDAIILARGGGSLEELWEFNNEEVAREIHKCKKPIVTGVGHETDFTIVDFVSDMRAPTPSAAAEVLVPDIYELNNFIEKIKDNIYENTINIINNKKNQLENFNKVLMLNSPLNNIINLYAILDNYKNSLNNSIKRILNSKQQKLEKLNLLICGNNPIKFLNKGFSIVYDDNYNVISSIQDIKKEDIINIKFKDGEAKLKIQILED